MMAGDEQIREICKIFQIGGEYRSYEPITYGHINTTSVSYTHLDVYKRQI